MPNPSKRLAAAAAVEAFVLGFAVIPTLLLVVGVVLIPLVQLVMGSNASSIESTFERNVRELIETSFTLGLLIAFVAAGVVFSSRAWPDVFARRENELTGRATRIDVMLALVLIWLVSFLSLIGFASRGLNIQLKGAFGVLSQRFDESVGVLASYAQRPFEEIAASLNWLLQWDMTVQPYWLHSFIAVVGILSQPLMFIELHPAEWKRRPTLGRALPLLFVAFLFLMLTVWSRSLATPLAVVFIIATFGLFEALSADPRPAQTDASDRQNEAALTSLARAATTFLLPFAVFVAIWWNHVG
jgi:hypothetical protein